MGEIEPNCGPLARLEAVIADPLTPGVVFAKLSDGERLSGIAKGWRVPKGKFAQWFMTEHERLYEAALKVRAAELAMDALDEAIAATPEDVAVRRLRGDVALKIASKFDRARYGEAMRFEKVLSVEIDAGLLGSAAQLLERLSPGVRIADTVTVEALSAPRAVVEDEDLI